jgi:hypothetical protein
MSLAESEIFAVVREDLRRATDEMSAILAVELYKTDPFLAQLPPPPPPTWRDRLRWHLRRWKWYWIIVGKALRGDDLVDRPSVDEWNW